MRLAGGRSVGVSERTALKVAPFVRQASGELAQAENEGWMDSAGELDDC